MKRIDKIKAMTLDEIAQRFAVNFLAGCYAVLRKAEIPEDIIRDFGRKNLVDIICEYKQWLQQEVNE